MSTELSFKQRVIIHLAVAAIYLLSNFTHGFYEWSRGLAQTTGQVDAGERFQHEFSLIGKVATETIEIQ